MRTPTEIFEEALESWDDSVIAHLRDSPYPDTRPTLDEHRNVAARLRSEFRQALAGYPGGLPPAPRCAFLEFDPDHENQPMPCGRPAPNYVSPDDGFPHCDQHRLPGDRRVTPWLPEQPSVYRPPFFTGTLDSKDLPPEPTASAEEAFGGLILPPGQPVHPPRVGPGDHLLRPEEEAEVRFDAPAPQPAEVYDLMQALKDSLAVARRESVADRAERLASRYTKDDGSAK